MLKPFENGLCEKCEYCDSHNICHYGEEKPESYKYDVHECEYVGECDVYKMKEVDKG